mgnify:CR=1 FL=1
MKIVLCCIVYSHGNCIIEKNIQIEYENWLARVQAGQCYSWLMWERNFEQISFFMQDTKYLMNQNKVDVAFAFTHFEWTLLLPRSH